MNEYRQQKSTLTSESNFQALGTSLIVSHDDNEHVGWAHAVDEFFIWEARSTSMLSIKRSIN